MKLCKGYHVHFQKCQQMFLNEAIEHHQRGFKLFVLCIWCTVLRGGIQETPKHKAVRCFMTTEVNTILISCVGWKCTVYLIKGPPSAQQNNVNTAACVEPQIKLFWASGHITPDVTFIMLMTNDYSSGARGNVAVSSVPANNRQIASPVHTATWLWFFSFALAKTTTISLFTEMQSDLQ